MHAGHLEVFIFSESLTETNGCVHHDEASASFLCGKYICDKYRSTLHVGAVHDALDKIGLFQSVWAI